MKITFEQALALLTAFAARAQISSNGPNELAFKLGETGLWVAISDNGVCNLANTVTA